MVGAKKEVKFAKHTGFTVSSLAATEGTGFPQRHRPQWLGKVQSLTYKETLC